MNMGVMLPLGVDLTSNRRLIAMLEEKDIKAVDDFGELLIEALSGIGERGDWGAKFTVSKAPGSDYRRSPVISGGVPIKKNWVQVNGQTYSHPSYSSPKPWKVQARFASSPGSPLWEKKPPYERDRQPLEWSLGGLDVWAISYESLSKALSERRMYEVRDEILTDLRASWAYANGQMPRQQYPADAGPGNRIEVSLSIDSKIWSEFQQIYAKRYRSRKKQPKRPSYGQLRDEALDDALRDYIEKWRS
jgi:hypothetical protein